MSDVLRTDLYQLTMMQAYMDSNHNPQATFDYFVRKTPFGSYLLAAGLEFVLDYVENLHFEEDDIEYLKNTGIFKDEFLEYLPGFMFTGDIHAMPEGSIAFPKEPVIRVTAPIIEAQLLETYILNRMNFSTLIATKASHVVYAAAGRTVAEFGLRRAQGNGHLEATRASYIGGCDSTSSVIAGKTYGIPISGTMAHSFVTSFEHEIDAFRAYAASFQDNCFLLIDTYDTIQGARKAVVVGKELEEKGYRLKGVRLDSGDLAGLSIEVRKILDDAGLPYVKIIASGDLNEQKIKTIMSANARIDGFGVGTELVTGKPKPALDGIYKLAEITQHGISIPKMKLSEDPGKANLPGKKMVWRFIENGKYAKDVIALDGENTEGMESGVPMLIPVVKNGHVICERPCLAEIKAFARKNLDALPELYRDFETSPVYQVELSPALEELRRETVLRIRREQLGTA